MTLKIPPARFCSSATNLRNHCTGGDYGMGTVFVINTDGSGYARLPNFGGTKHDGVKPIDNVILLNGTLYSMTTEGGDSDQGTIFSVPAN